MKMQAKISIFCMVLLTGAILAVVMVGAKVINGIVDEANKDLLYAEISNVNKTLSDGYHGLRTSGGISDAGRRAELAVELVDGLKRQDKLGRSGALHIFDEGNQPLTGENPIDGGTVVEMRRQRMGYKDVTTGDGDGYSAMFMVNEDWDWLITILLPREQMLGKRNYYLRVTLLLAGGILALSLFVAYQVSGRLTQHLSDILVCVRRVGDGDFDQKISLPASSPSDLRDLQDGINKMTGQLKRREQENKLAQDERQKHQKLESVGVLAGGIAHDFNNLLTAILGNVQLAMMRIKDEDTKVLLRDTERAVARSMTLTRQLLTFSKGGNPIKQLSSVADVVESTAKFAVAGARSRCVFKFSPDISMAEIDQGQIAQVVQNLVINASQAMPEGGNIEIEAKNVYVGDGGHLPIEPGRYVTVTVSDDGPGISPENIERIFDPFFTTKPNGTGLGLATSYAIVKKHGGYLTCESHPGVGASFIVYLPASERKAPANQEGMGKLFKGSRRVLVMDDQSEVRDIVGRYLREMGCECDFTEHGEQAISMYRRNMADNPYDLVILDLTVPGGWGGKECLARLLEIDPRATTVVTSGYSNDPIMANYRKHGFKHRLVKPFTIHQLSEVLKTLFPAE